MNRAYRLKLFDILEEGVLRDSQNVALQYNDICLTYRDLMCKVKERARVFKENGISKGKKVGLILENPYEFIITFFAVSCLEGILMPIFYNTGEEKINDIIKKNDINFVVANVDLKYKKVYESKDKKMKLFFCSGLMDEGLHDVSLILFTSGTTSTPKAIMLTNDNICSNVQAISEYLGLNPNDRILLIKNLCHASSLIGELFVGIYNGCTIILETKLPVTSMILNLIEKKNITVFFAVPTILKGFITCNKIKAFNLDKLKIINFYGAPMSQEDIKRLCELLPNCNLIYSYGQTEASPRVTYIERNDLIKRPSSSGKTIADVTLKIVNELNQQLAPFEEGEIIVYGPNVMKGYYRNKEKSEKTIIDGWLHTGDIGYLDDDGFLYVKGRRDNLLISFGKNIYLEEIEKTIVSKQGISEALVVGNKREDGTIELCAYVVLENRCITVSEIHKYCISHLENYKVPKKIVVVENLEKTNSGKLRRNC